MLTVTLRCERSEPRRATASAPRPYPSRAASRPPQDDGLHSQSNGSTLTIDAPWLLPIHSVPGFFASSTKTRRILVGRGSGYSVYCPDLMSRRATRSVFIDAVQALPFLSAIASYGADHGVGTFHSWIFPVSGSSMP